MLSLDGMADQTLSFEVYKQKVTTLRDALAGALRLEVWQATHQRNEASTSQGIRTAQVDGDGSGDGVGMPQSADASGRQIERRPQITARSRISY